MSWREIFWEAFSDVYELVVWFYGWLWKKLIVPCLSLFLALMALSFLLTVVSIASNYASSLSFRDQVAWLSSKVN